jgi:nucleotide-binding universal stress UspA family protein
MMIFFQCGWGQKKRNLARGLQPAKVRRSDMKILLATDGSDYSEAAVNSVAERPWPEGSEVQIISAMKIPYAPATEAWVLPNGYYIELERVARDQSEAAVRDAVKRIESGKTSGLEIITKIISGSAGGVILDEAERWDADMIVLGSHGYNALQRFLLGSVSHAVATHARCSVEIVRQKPRAEK